MSILSANRHVGDFNQLKDWIIDKCVKENVRLLDYESDISNSDPVMGFLYLNDLFDNVPKSYLFKDNREVFLIAINDLCRDNVLQHLILDDYDGENGYYNFGKAAVAFAYYQTNTPQKRIAASMNAIHSELKVLSKNIKGIHDATVNDNFMSYQVRCNILFDKLSEWADKNNIELPITLDDLLVMRK